MVVASPLPSTPHPLQAEAQIEKYTRMGFDKLPICMAKTQYSFSHDAAKKGEGAWGRRAGAQAWAGEEQVEV